MTIAAGKAGDQRWLKAVLSGWRAGLLDLSGRNTFEWNPVTGSAERTDSDWRIDAAEVDGVVSFAESLRVLGYFPPTRPSEWSLRSVPRPK